VGGGALDVSPYTGVFDAYGDEIPCVRPWQTLSREQQRVVLLALPDAANTDGSSNLYNNTEEAAGLAITAIYLAVRMAKTTLIAHARNIPITRSDVFMEHWESALIKTVLGTNEPEVASLFLTLVRRHIHSDLQGDVDLMEKLETHNYRANYEDILSSIKFKFMAHVSQRTRQAVDLWAKCNILVWELHRHKNEVQYDPRGRKNVKRFRPKCDWTRQKYIYKEHEISSERPADAVDPNEVLESKIFFLNGSRRRWMESIIGGCFPFGNGPWHRMRQPWSDVLNASNLMVDSAISTHRSYPMHSN
jgi:hypothetical protein